MHTLEVIGAFILLSVVFGLVSWFRRSQFSRGQQRRSGADGQDPASHADRGIQVSSLLARAWPGWVAAGVGLIVAAAIAHEPFMTPAGSFYIVGLFLLAAGIKGGVAYLHSVRSGRPVSSITGPRSQVNQVALASRIRMASMLAHLARLDGPSGDRGPLTGSSVDSSSRLLTARDLADLPRMPNVGQTTPRRRFTTPSGRFGERMTATQYPRVPPVRRCRTMRQLDQPETNLTTGGLAATAQSAVPPLYEDCGNALCAT